jgi:hypothetical protein
VLHLAKGAYGERGAADDNSSYAGTIIRLANLAAATAPAAPVTKPAAKPAAKPKPKPKAVSKPKQKPAATTKTRTPAFTVAGAPQEPVDEITLSARALRLDAWLGTRKKTRSNVQHWLYQHAWIVTGARFGWSHGAQALETLVRVDERVQRQWGIGARSEAVARAALARVRRQAQ